MRLRITETKEGSAKVIRIEGELLAEGVSELERVCQEAAAPLRLDVTELRLVDSSGISSIRSLAEEGAQLSGLSPYIKLLLSRED